MVEYREATIVRKTIVEEGEVGQISNCEHAVLVCVGALLLLAVLHLSSGYITRLLEPQQFTADRPARSL